MKFLVAMILISVVVSRYEDYLRSAFDEFWYKPSGVVTTATLIGGEVGLIDPAEETAVNIYLDEKIERRQPRVNIDEDKRWLYWRQVFSAHVEGIKALQASKLRAEKKAQEEENYDAQSYDVTGEY